MIRIEELKKVYSSGTVETTALAGVDLEIESGEFVSIMGPSGSGKSTLLHILGLLDVPSAGEYYLADERTSNLSERRRTNLRREKIGFVFQNFNLVEEMTIYENVELPLLYSGIAASQRRQRVEELLDQVGVLNRKDHFPSQLSGGQQQRAAIGRALIGRPSLILADEPTGNLDSIQGREVMELMVSFVERGTTLVMVTHALDSARYGHRILNLLDGKPSEDPKPV